MPDRHCRFNTRTQINTVPKGYMPRENQMSNEGKQPCVGLSFSVKLSVYVCKCVSVREGALQCARISTRIFRPCKRLRMQEITYYVSTGFLLVFSYKTFNLFNILKFKIFNFFVLI